MSVRESFYFSLRSINALALIALFFFDPLCAIAACSIIWVLPTVLQIPEQTLSGRKAVTPTAMLMLFATIAGAWLIATRL